MARRKLKKKSKIILVSSAIRSVPNFQSNTFHSSQNRPNVKKLFRHRSLPQQANIPDHYLRNGIDKKHHIHRVIHAGINTNKTINKNLRLFIRKSSQIDESSINCVNIQSDRVNSQNRSKSSSIIKHEHLSLNDLYSNSNHTIRDVYSINDGSISEPQQNTISNNVNNSIKTDISEKRISNSSYKKIHRNENKIKGYRKKQKHRRSPYCLCSPCCTVLSVIAGILLMAALSALIIALIGDKQQTITTTTVSTITILSLINNLTTNITNTTLTINSSSSISTTSTIPTTTSSFLINLTTTSITMSTSSLSTTITTTTDTTTITSSTSSTITTSTSTSTSPTTTVRVCGSSCLNQSWINLSGIIAQWPFDGSYIDITNKYNATPLSNAPYFVSGYIGQAISLNSSYNQSLYTSYIPLYNISFTIDAWIYINVYTSATDYSIIGMCPSGTTRNCLQASIRSKKLWFSFWLPDSASSSLIYSNQWIHTAFIYDSKARTMTSYLNGFIDGFTSSADSLKCQTGRFTIGIHEVVRLPNNLFQGYIDNLSINGRVKSSCEILEMATLSARFKFDIGSVFDDSGPNALQSTGSNYSIISGYINEAISFFGLSNSYFQSWSFTSFSTMNKPFSISFWIKPQLLSGTLVHLSTSSSGTGSSCFPLLGFASNGSIVAQVLISNGNLVTAVGPVLPISSLWIPIVQTWNSTSGLKLYVNNTLVSSVTASTFLTSNSTINYLTLANCINGCGLCSNGLINSPGPFLGAIDEWQIFSRELNEDDVCAHYYAR